jgi:site-specific DNA-methyltransferase (adenine-specific)/modification methylase
MEREQIGACTLIRGDCLEILADLTVDVVLTDPPYGIHLASHDPRRRRTTPIAGDTSQDRGTQVLAWAERHQLPTAVFASPQHPWPGHWRQWLVWDKGGAVGGGGDPRLCWKQTWELIQIARNKPLNGLRENAVLRYPHGPAQSRHHPAEKPTALMRYLVSKLTQPTELVCDPFMGSGTTGLACVALGCAFLGVEIDPRFFDIACQRITAAYAQSF